MPFLMHMPYMVVRMSFCWEKSENDAQTQPNICGQILNHRMPYISEWRELRRKTSDREVNVLFK